MMSDGKDNEIKPGLKSSSEAEEGQRPGADVTTPADQPSHNARAHCNSRNSGHVNPHASGQYVHLVGCMVNCIVCMAKATDAADESKIVNLFMFGLNTCGLIVGILALIFFNLPDGQVWAGNAFIIATALVQIISIVNSTLFADNKNVETQSGIADVEEDTK